MMLTLNATGAFATVNPFSLVKGARSMGQELCPTFYYGNWNGVHYYFGDVRDTETGECPTTTGGASSNRQHELGGCPGCPDPIPMGSHVGVSTQLIKKGIPQKGKATQEFNKAFASVTILLDRVVSYVEKNPGPVREVYARLFNIAAAPPPAGEEPNEVRDKIVFVGQEIEAPAEGEIGAATHVGYFGQVAESCCHKVRYRVGNQRHEYAVVVTKR
jgi:hypothetical protein